MQKAKLQTKKLLKQGGMLQEGGTVDPVSGNEVPVGAMQEEVRDDVPAQLSEGEFVFPADVVRYIGLERLMMMRQAAKEGLQKMEAMGQMSNSEEATMEDDVEFESEIDDILKEIEGKEEEEPEEEGEEEEESEEEEDKGEEAKMAEGGMAMPDMGQNRQPAMQAEQPTQAPRPTPEQMAEIERTAQALREREPEVANLPPSKPTEGLTPSAIIKNNFGAENQAEADQFIQKVERLNRANKTISTRHNDTVIIGFVKRPGVIDPYFFTQDTPEKLNEAITVGIDVAKKAGITRLESDTKGNVEPLRQLGYDVQETETGWSLDL